MLFRSAVIAEIGADKVGIRISPGSTASGISETDSWGAYEALLGQIDGLGLAYLHVLIEPDDEILTKIRSAWTGTLVLNTGFALASSKEDLAGLLDNKIADAVTVGRQYIANPDLVKRWTLGSELNEPDSDTFYGGGAEGYTDYPALSS